MTNKLTPQEMGKELVESSAVAGAVKREAQSSLAVGCFTNKIVKITHLLITEKNSNEIRLSGRFGFVMIIITCCVGLLICSDGKAEDIKCATVTVIETGEEILSCFDIETTEYVDCTQKENLKKCHIEVLESY